MQWMKTLAVVLALVASGVASEDFHSSKSQKQVTIIEFADFQCPFCRSQAPTIRKLQAEYGDRVSIQFKHFPMPFHSWARGAHRAAIAAAQQGKFWEMHDLIFSHAGNLSRVDCDHFADQLGLDKAQFDRAMDSDSDATIAGDLAEGQRQGVTGTPTLVVDGHLLEGAQSYAALKQIIDAELDGAAWDSRLNDAPVSLKIEGSPSRGPADAPVTIIEFADFECPFCARANAGLEQLLPLHPNVRLVFKNFPLEMHADSPLAHMAALAAGEQNKFWEMQDLIFAHQREIKRDNLIAFARQLNLDMDRFDRDLSNPNLAQRLESDREEGTTLGVSGTPTFIVNGQKTSGFDESRLEGAISEALRVASLRPKSTDTEENLPKVDVSLGIPKAHFKVEWFADLGSPLTARSLVRLQDFMARHQDDVQVTFRNFPLQNRPGSRAIHEFVLSAAAQGKFWQTLHLLLASATNVADRGSLAHLIQSLGLDEKKTLKEIDGQEYGALIDRDIAEAKSKGVTGSPTFIVNGKRLDGVDGILHSGDTVVASEAASQRALQHSELRQ